MQSSSGQIIEPYSISAGLDYPGIGPQLAHLIETKRASILNATGKVKNYTVEQIREFQRFQSNFPNQKAMLGFGIHNQRNFKTANYYFSGGIIGSAFIRKQKNKAEAIAFIRSLSSPSSV